MDIKEALKNGVTIEELVQSFKNQIEEAKDKLAEEENTNDLNIARKNFINAMVTYIEKLGLFDEETDESIKKAKEGTEEYLKKIERSLKEISNWENSVNRMYKNIFSSKENKDITGVTDSISELKKLINELK